MNTNPPNPATSGTTRNTQSATWRKIYTFLLRYGTFLTIVVVFFFFSTSSPIFLTPGNLLNILRQMAVLAVAAFGMTAVVMGGGTHVISGGIDLSIAAIIGFVTALVAILITGGQPVWAALGIGLAAALLIETVNALLVAYLKLIPLLATLAMMYIINGVELVLTQNKNIPVDSPLVRLVADGSVMGVPASVIILLVVFAGYWVLLHFTRFGAHLQAVGGNPEAARASGLSVNGYLLASYLLAGFAATVSSVLVLSRLSGSTPGISSLLLLDIVLATYVSSSFSTRGVVNIPGVLIGAVFVGVLTNGFTLINVPVYWVYGVKGLLVLLVVSANALQQKEKN